MSRRGTLGPVLATIVVAGNMIGSGVFLLPATLAAVGSVTVIGWLVASVGAVMLALLFSRMAGREPMAGGPATYAFDAFGPFVGMQASLWYWVACLVGNVAIAAAAAGYLVSFFGISSSATGLAMIAVGLLWLVTIANFVSPRFIGQLDGPLLIVGLVPLLLIATVGWLYFDPAQFAASWNVSGTSAFRAVPNSLVLVFWAFVGLESASVCAGVVENPRRNVPIASMAGVALAALVYIAVSGVIMGLAPADVLAKSTAPLALVATRIFGPVAGPLVACAGMMKALGTLAGWVLLTGQVSRAAADHGLMPRIFARTRRGEIPVAGLVIAGVFGSLAIVLTVAPTLGQQFGLLSDAATVFNLLTYVAGCAAAIRYGARGELTLAVLGSLFCVYVIVESNVPVLKVAFLLMVAAALCYLPRAARKQRSADPAEP